MSGTRSSLRHRQSRKAAMRIAAFLHAIGIVPALSGCSWTEILHCLVTQYESLPADVRKEARRHGRTLIRKGGFRELAKTIIAGPPPTPPKLKARRTSSKRLPKCDRCRTAWAYKSIWDIRLLKDRPSRIKKWMSTGTVNGESRISNSLGD